MSIRSYLNIYVWFFILILGAVSLLFVSVWKAHAAQIPPQIFTYQGRLTDSGGNLLGGVGTTYYFKFSIWNNPTVGNGSRVWPSAVPTSIGTTVKQGVFTINIGDTANGYPDVLNFDFSSTPNVYLQIEASTNNSTFETLSPRQQITSAAFAQVAGAVVGTTTPSVFGTTTPATNSFVTIAATSTDSIPLSIVAALNQAANLFQVQDNTNTNLFSISATGGVTAGAATTTSLFSTTASSTNLFTSNFSIGSLTGFLKATAGVVATALVDLASDITGILAVGNGGTGVAAIQSGSIPYGNGTSAIATTTAGTAGYVLSYLNGIPTWTATTTAGTGLTYTSGAFNVNTTQNIAKLSNLTTNGFVKTSGGDGTLSVDTSTYLTTALTAIGPLGQTQTGPTVTFATSSTAWNGLTASTTITGSSNTLTFVNTLAGLLNTAGGGTGLSSIADGSLLFGSGSTALTALATTSGSGRFLSLDYSTGRPSWVATSSLGVAISETTGTLSVSRGGTGQTSFGQGWLHSDGTTFTSSTSPTVNYLIATSTTASQLPYASSTALTVSGTASTSNLIVSNNFTFKTVTGFLKATAGVVATALVDLASDVTGVLIVGNGGTGTTTAPTSQLLYGGSGGVYQSVATSSLSVGTGLTNSGTLGYQVGGSAVSISFAPIAANSLWVNQTGASAVPTVIATSSLFQNASASLSGLLTSTDWTTFNAKVGGSGTTNTIPKFTASGTIGNSSITDDGTIVTVNTAGYIATRLGIGSDSPPTGDPNSILNVKATLSPGSLGTYPGLDFHVKTTGATVNVLPIGIRAIAEYIGSTSLALTPLQGIVGEARYSAVVTPTYKTQAVGLLGIATQNSAITMVGGGGGAYPGGNIGVKAAIESTASGTGLMGASFGFYVDSISLDGTGLPSSYTLYGARVPDFNYNTGNSTYSIGAITGQVSGMILPNMTAAGSSLQVGLQINAQTGGANVLGLWLNGNALGADVVFGTAKSAKIYYDGTNLIINPKTAGAGVLSILGSTRLQSTALLGTAVAGGVEFLTDDYYATITTGASRKKFVLDDGTALTSGRIPFATTNGRLTDSGNLVFDGTNFGIGTTSPYAKLSVVGQTVAEYFTATSTTATSTFMGAVGIGTSTPWRTLSVNGTVALNGLSTDTTVGLAGSICLDANNELKKLSGSATCITSSQAYKHNITDLLHGLDWVRALRPVTFAYNANNTESLGFIAEEVDQVSPLLTVRNDKGEVYSVHYELIPAVLTKAVQELDARVSALEANAGVAKDMTSGWSIDASGRLVVNEIQTNKLCVGTVCVTQEQFLKMVQSSGAAVTEVIPPPVVDTTATTTVVATTTLPADTTPPDTSIVSTTSTDVIPPPVADATSTTVIATP